MQYIRHIKELKNIQVYLQKRGLVNQYRKAKNYILLGEPQRVNLKLRHPKKNRIYYFRINKQYRAFASLVDDVLVVFEIYDHQK